jgi:hypothetical protein
MAELKPCPFCGSEVRLVRIQSGFAIVCNSRNCLGSMRVNYGSCDNEKIFMEKLFSDWNKREPEVLAVTAAVECIEEYRNTLYDKTQEPYDEHGYCCISVLDEVLNRLRCFTASAAVEAWRAEDGN